MHEKSTITDGDEQYLLARVNDRNLLWLFQLLKP